MIWARELENFDGSASEADNLEMARCGIDDLKFSLDFTKQAPHLKKLRHFSIQTLTPS